MALSLRSSWLRRPEAAGNQSARLAMDALEWAFVCLFASFVVTAWLSFLLAEFGKLRGVFVLGFVIVSFAVSITLLYRSYRPGALSAGISVAVPLVVGLFLFLPPDEWILGGLDPGGYISAGAAIARDGSIVQPAPEVAALPPAIQNALFIADGNRLAGWYLVFPRFNGLLPEGIVVASDRVVPHGFHLFPVVLAFGNLAGGIRGELLIPPLLALGAVAAYSLLARRLFGPTVALLAAGFLVLNPAEIWFARYPDAELLAQLLLFGGLFIWAIAEERNSLGMGALAGFAVGMVHLTKIETLPLVGIILAYGGYRLAVNRFSRPLGAFSIAYLLVLVHAVLHAVLIAWWYTTTTLHSVTSPRALLLAGAGLGAYLVGVSVLAALPRLRSLIARRGADPRLTGVLSIGLPLGIGLLAVYAYLVRPAHPLPAPAADLSPAAVYAINNLESFVRLGWFVTPLGLMLGTLGYMLLARQQVNLRTALLLLLLASDTVLFLSDLKITPVYYWAARRWIPLVIPGFSLAAGYFLSAMFARLRQVRFGFAAPAVLCAGMALGLLHASRPLLLYVEYRGAVDQVGKVASVLPPDSVTLLVDGDAGIRLSVPLQYLYGRTSFVVKQDPSTEVALRTASQRWLQQGTPVYWITTPDLPDPSEIGYPGTIVARQRISLPEKVATRDVPPGAGGAFQQDLIIWQLAPGPVRSQTP